MDRRLSAGGDSGRTPMAWRHRDQLYSQQQGYHNGEIYSTAHAAHAAHAAHGPHGGRSTRSSSGGRGGPHQQSRPPRTASPPETSNSSSLSSESQAPPHHAALGMSAAASLSTWDGELGEPYSALHYGHGHVPGHGALHPHPGLPGMGMPPGMAGMAPGMLMLPPGYALHGVHGMPSAVMLAPPPGPPPGPPPAILLPPMLRPRPLVFPAAPTTPTPPEPLPVREPKAALAALALPPKELLVARNKVRCCRGGCVVLWIIVGLILLGALLATALRFVFP